MFIKRLVNKCLRASTFNKKQKTNENYKMHPVRLIYKTLIVDLLTNMIVIAAWIVADLVHKAVGITGKGNYRCTNCGRTYSQNYNLRRHLDYECGQEPRFKCGNCGKKFKRKSVLQEHLVYIHRFNKEDAKNISNNS